MEVSWLVNRCFESAAVLSPRHFEGAKLGEVLRDPLGVEQAVAAGVEPANEVDEGNLAGVHLAAEHAFAEEGSAESHTIQPADEVALTPALYGVGEAVLMKLTVKVEDAVVYPGIFAAGSGLSAGEHDVPKGCVGSDIEVPSEHRSP